MLAADPSTPRSVTERRWQSLAALMGLRCAALAPLVRVAPLPDGVLLVRDRRAAYSVVTPEGSSEVPVREARWWRVTLVASPSVPASPGWRILGAVPVPSPEPPRQ